MIFSRGFCAVFCSILKKKSRAPCVCFVILPPVLSIQMRRNRLENGMRQNLSKGFTQALQRAFNDSNIRVQVCIACSLRDGRQMCLSCHPSHWNRKVKWSALHYGKAAFEAFMQYKYHAIEAAVSRAVAVPSLEMRNEENNQTNEAEQLVAIGNAVKYSMSWLTKKKQLVPLTTITPLVAKR